MTLRLRAKVLLHVWSYDFYDMTLSIEEQRCHVIRTFNITVSIPLTHLFINSSSRSFKYIENKTGINTNLARLQDSPTQLFCLTFDFTLV